MSSTVPRFLHRLGVAALTAAMAWVALWSWGGLVENPGRFLSPAVTAGLLVVVVGAAGRALDARWYAVLPAQVVVLGLWFNHRYAEPASWLGWLPTPSSIAEVAEHVRDGAVAVNTYASPVSSDHPETYAYLLGTAILVMLSTDLLACGLRRVPWAGLPLIVTLTVPISVLEGGLSWVVFVLTGLLFMMLLATEETERVLGWGRSVAGRGERIDSLDQVVNGSTIRGSAFRIGLLTATSALVLPALLPLGDGILDRDDGSGEGGGRGATVALRNPIVDLRRDLISQDHIPLLDATTTADPSYLRLTVLDRFNGAEWLPSPRELDRSNRADGDLPTAPGLSPARPGDLDQWDLDVLNFRTTWLPTPYPTRQIDIDEGDWRYDRRTLDVASVDGPAGNGLSYRLTGFTPDFSADTLDRAPAPPVEVAEPMTALPDDVPEVIGDVTRQVTAGATSDHQRMVQLQSWFRNSGGFRYSLEEGGGSGLSQLARFITVEKVGYCEQYAAAMAVMARTLDIPARVVVGFLSPEDTGPDRYRFTSDDLHAWPEIYFSGHGWVRFEPTPASRTGVAPAWTTGAGAVVPTPTAAATPTPAPATRGPADETSTDSGAEGSGASVPTLLAWALGATLLLLLLATPRLRRDRQRHRRLAAASVETPGVDARALVESVWAELCATARDLRIALPLDRSVRVVGRTLAGRAVPGTDVADLGRLVDLVERARYGRAFDLDGSTHADAVRTVARWSDVLASSVPAGRARRAKVLPASALARPGHVVTAGRADELVGATAER